MALTPPSPDLDAADCTPRKFEISEIGTLTSVSLNERASRLAKEGRMVESVVWEPGPALAGRLPNGFALPLTIVRGTDGHRRIVPTTDLKRFLLQAAQGGLAQLQVLKGLSQAERQSYRLMSFLYQWGYSDRRLMARRFMRQEDLRLRRSERAGEERDILPEIEIPDGTGCRRLKVEDLVAAGQAALPGAPNVTTEMLLNQGLFEIAAGQWQLLDGFTAADSNAMIRNALFGMDQGEC